MRKLIGTLLALGMLMSGVFGVAAQDAPANSVANGLNSPATWTDDRGNAVATIEVNEVNPDWTDYSEYSEPERGYVFQAVTFTITNISGNNMIVEPYDFSLVDSEGRNNGRSYASPAEGLEGSIFEEDLPLSADESAELTVVFQTPAEISAAVFVWQPDSGVLVMVNVGEQATENAPVASGLNAPVTWIDDRGNPVATLEVTGIEDDWQDFGEYNEPERGMVYRAVHVKITNISGSSLIVEPYDFTMVDSTGLNNGRSWAEAAEGSDVVVMTEDVPLGDGESFEGVLVFQMYPDLTPSAILWQPDSGLLSAVFLTESTGTEASPVASPATEDVVATPAN